MSERNGVTLKIVDYIAPDQLHAHVRAELCACGGIVVADPRSPTQGMHAHQAGDAHAAWRMRGGMVQIDVWWAERGLLVERNGVHDGAWFAAGRARTSGISGAPGLDVGDSGRERDSNIGGADQPHIGAAR